MAFATIAEAEVRIAELEKENNGLTRESKSYRLNEKKLKDFLSSKGFEIDKDFEEQWDEMEKKNGIVKTEAEKQQKAMEKQQKQIDDLLAKLAQKETESNEQKLRSEIISKFGDDVIDVDEIADNWLLKKIAKIEDGKFYKVEDGKDVPLEIAISAYKKNNPHRVKMNQANGGGSHPNNEQQKTEPQKIAHKEFRKLAPTAQKDFLDKGGEVLPG
jgi:hypothetical protein